MSTLLTVTWENPKHRFLDTKHVTVEVGGKPPASYTPGRCTFKLDGEGPHAFKLTVNDDQSQALLTLEQSLQIKESGGAATLSPGDSTWGDKLHPRLFTPTTSAEKGKGAHVKLEADLRFLDITDYLQRTSPTGKVKKGGDREDFKPCWDAFKAAKITGVRLRFFEYTPQENPRVWGVVVTDAAESMDEVGALLFYRPSIKDRSVFTVPEDADYSTIFRFLNPPKSERQPFFGQQKSDGTPYFEKYPNCDFLRQLADFGKKLVFMFPIPTNGTEFGWTKNGHVLEVIDSLFATLRSQHLIGSKRRPVKRSRLALAAYSAGGHGLWPALFAQRAPTPKPTQDDGVKTVAERVHELYLFDPVRTGSNQARLIKWLQKDPKDRRLGMIGWYQHKTMLAIHTEESAALVYPEARKYWYQDNLYRRALRIDDAKGLVEVGQSGPASEISGVYFAKQTPDDKDANIHCVVEDEEHNRETFENATAHELGAILYHYNKSRNKTSSFRESIQTLRALTKDGKKSLAVNEIDNLRHQWPVVGGLVRRGEAESVETRGEITGYLRVLLDKSGF